MDLPIRTDEETFVILGVDTHADAHVAVALDGLGRRLGHTTVPSTEAGAPRGLSMHGHPIRPGTPRPLIGIRERIAP